MILGLCERFGCLPSALYREDARLLQLLELENYGDKRDQQEKLEELEAQTERGYGA